MKCLIVDDHPVTVFGLGHIIRAQFPGCEIFQAETVADAAECLRTHSIDLMLLDLMLSGDSGLNLLAQLRNNATAHPAHLIVVSNIDDQETIDLCRNLGAHGFVSKKNAFASISNVVKNFKDGNHSFPTSRDWITSALLNDQVKFTPRQRDIIDLLLNGYTNKRIASELGLSYGTVKNYMFDLMRMMAVKSRFEMVIKMQQSGYVPRAPGMINLPKNIVTRVATLVE